MLTVLGLVVCLALVWYTRHVFLLAFAGVLLAVLFSSLAQLVCRYTRLPYRWSLALVLVLLAVAVGLGVWLLGQQIAQQASDLVRSLPQSIERLRRQLQQYAWGEWLVHHVVQGQSMLSESDLFARITGVASSTVSFVAGIAVVLFVGVYGAAESGLYVDGMTRLAPIAYRQRFRTVLLTVGYNLRWWLWGQLATMTMVGVLVGVGLGLLGIPQALALALLAFALDLIPNVGPVLAAIPGLMLASTQGTGTLLYAVALYWGVQILEGYVVLPLIQRKTVWLPPAVGLLSILLFGLIGGPIGVLVAAPLSVALMTLVKMLYVEDLLGDCSLDVPGAPPR
jgi:predicted PurR-regulated permease PerM